ncbi:hypothetical protein FKW77_006796 [Venturia effusa]|uniref:Uncharacterized protein n=1 Tax=Venturia effusa TaxID=50376 RepID=A0A517L1I3_9PEZI|nr:hypothetical protein FKW77_006796 [Venturia effusa]
MCEITVTKYVRPDGSRHSVEKKKLCDRSDGKECPLKLRHTNTDQPHLGVNPCYFQTKQELTEFLPPNLDYNSPSPPSTGGPGTPVYATANYEVRVPLSRNGSSSKGKGRAKAYNLSVNTSGKRPKTSRPNSSERPRPRFDNDPIVAIEEGGRRSSISPITRRSPHGSPRSRVQRPAAIIHQQPVSSLHSIDNPHRPSSTGTYHRRTSTAPGPIDYNPDNEIFDRANARDELRRQNRDRQRREDEDRRMAEDRRREENRKAAEKEAREKAADEYFMRDFARLNERDRLRQDEARRRQETEEDEERRRVRDIKARQEREAQQQALDDARRLKEARDDARRRQEAQADAQRRQEAQEEVRRQQEAFDRARQAHEQDLAERIAQEELDRRSRERAAQNELHMREIDEEVHRLDQELVKIQERSAARARALQLEQDVREHDRLRDEIRQLEEEHFKDTTAVLPSPYASEIDDLEAELQHLNTRIHARERGSATSPITDSLWDRVAPPRTPTSTTSVSVLHSNPFQDEEYRRMVGRRVLERERSMAASVDVTGVSRRNTIGGGGGGKARERHYRNLRRWYPE